MKRIILISLTLFAFDSTPPPPSRSCNPDEFTVACIPKLAEGFNFLKTYQVQSKNGSGTVEYSYVFTKGTEYMINLCSENQSNDGIEVSLFDYSRNKVASSKINNVFVSAIAYPCNATGIYYIRYSFEDRLDRCGGSALGFKR